MKTSFVDKLCCPFDHASLSLAEFVKNQSGDILEGLLTCPNCKRYYPIIYGIPIMTPDTYRENALEAPVMARWLPGYRANGFQLLEGEPEADD